MSISCCVFFFLGGGYSRNKVMEIHILIDHKWRSHYFGYICFWRRVGISCSWMFCQRCWLAFPCFYFFFFLQRHLEDLWRLSTSSILLSFFSGVLNDSILELWSTFSNDFQRVWGWRDWRWCSCKEYFIGKNLIFICMNFHKT